MRAPRAGALLLLVAFLAAATASCIISRGVEVSPLRFGQSDSTTVRSAVKAHLVDGAVALFPEGVTVARNRIIGDGRRYDATLKDSVAVREIALDSVIGMEAFRTRFDNLRTVVYSTLATVGVLAGTVAAICISDPKCFGSCPTIYSDSAGVPVLEAEGFSYSISPLLEGRDVDRLRAQPDSTGRLRLQVWNEALETHYINQMELLEATHAPDELVVPDERSRPVAIRGVTTPSSMVDRARRDVRAILAEADGRIFTTDSATLASASPEDAEDYIDLAFPNPRRGDRLAVVLRLRNSLLNTVLFYDLMLARPGARSIDWIANDLERISPTLDLGRWYASHLGLRVFVADGERWKLVARLSDYGPIAWRDVAAVVGAPSGDSIRLRLSFLADQWRIDRIAVGAAVRRPAVRVVPLAAVVNSAGVVESRALEDLRRADDRYLQTTPPQRFTVDFNVGAAPSGSARTFFIVSQGYYIEWVRGDWMRGLRDTTTFRPGDAALLHTLRSWAAQKSSLEQRFYRTRIPVR